MIYTFSFLIEHAISIISAVFKSILKCTFFTRVHPPSHKRNVRTIPLDIFHDESNPALRGVGFSTGTSLDKSRLVGGRVQLGKVLFPWDGQRDVLEVLQSHRNLIHEGQVKEQPNLKC